MAELLMSTVDEWGLFRTVIAYVHDNASNIVLANKPQYVPWKLWPCVAHTLQLAVNDGMKKAEFDDDITVCNKLLGTFPPQHVSYKIFIIPVEHSAVSLDSVLSYHMQLLFVICSSEYVSSMQLSPLFWLIAVISNCQKNDSLHLKKTNGS